MALPARLRDQPLKQQAADALAAHAFLDAEGDLGPSVVRLLRRMQLRRAANHPALHVGNDDRAIVGTFGRIAFDKTVIEIAVETVVAALRIEPQQVIAQ
jgi:hypothetical protein